MRVLLPQGREFRYHFNDELGWKAAIVVSTGSEEPTLTAFYRKACMNPARCVVLEGELGTSKVLFTPIDGKEFEQIVGDLELDRMTASALRRMRRQYKELTR